MRRSKHYFVIANRGVRVPVHGGVPLVPEDLPADQTLVEHKSAVPRTPEEENQYLQQQLHGWSAPSDKPKSQPTSVGRRQSRCARTTRAAAHTCRCCYIDTHMDVHRKSAVTLPLQSRVPA